MVKLRLLGSASIEAPDGLVAGRAAQGRRLALLALLALARGRPLSRDKLVGLLWPEASPDRARPQLSDALYVVRSALGEAAVQSVGDGLALDTALVTSDVLEFEALVEAGRPEEAVALYAGPLMDGFHLPDSTEFEHWMDGERGRLERLYLEALEKLAGAAGDPSAAVGWWRRRAAHDPFNGRIALRLMQALDAAGDRAGALQHARVHATLLRAEFDAGPDADVSAYADRLRAEQVASAEPGPTGLAASTGSGRTGLAASTGSGRTGLAASTGSGRTGLAASTGSERGGHAVSIHSGRSEPPAATQTPAHVPSSFSAIRSSASRSFIADQAPAVSTVPTDARRSVRARMTTAVVAALILLVFAVAYVVRRAGATAPPRAVGVLPFVNMSADPDNTYFSDGLSEQIILALSRIDGLQVAARTSSFALRNRELDVRAVGEALGVQAVLEGSVLVDGNRLRVIAQLIDARTGYHIWAEHYDSDVRDVIGVQDRIAEAIASALHLRLAGPGTPAARVTPGLAAYDLYLRGLYLRNSLSADALRQASLYFDSAIALEPRFAHAWAAKASVIAPLGYFGYAGRDTVMTEMRRATARALELDPALGEAHAAVGVLELFYEWNWEAARAALMRAIELNPNDAHAWHHLANYHIACGSLEEAVRARERAVELDPLNARTRIVLSNDLALAGDMERSLDHARRAAELDPMHPLLLGYGPNLPVGAVDTYIEQGRFQEAADEYLRIAALRGATRAEIDAISEGWRNGGLPGLHRAWLAMDLRQSGANMNSMRMSALLLVSGDTAQALDWLERAHEERNPGMIYMAREPRLAALAWHPRVARIAREMKLPALD